MNIGMHYYTGMANPVTVDMNTGGLGNEAIAGIAVGAVVGGIAMAYLP